MAHPQPKALPETPVTISELRTGLKQSQQVRDILMDLYDSLKQFQDRASQLDPSSDAVQSLKEILSNSLECVNDDFDNLLEQEQETHRLLQRTMRNGDGG